MEWQIREDERAYLRELAAKQAGYAALPIVAQRKQMWYDLNDGRPGAEPPVVVETWTFDRDFMPDDVFRCTSTTGRAIERQLLRNVRNHELIDDDKVTPDTFDIGWIVDIDEMGVQIGKEAVKDAQGIETGYRFLHPIVDLDSDLELLKPAVCRVDRPRTMAWQAFLEDLLGDLLPVRIRSSVYGNAMLTHRVVELMGMQAIRRLWARRCAGQRSCTRASQTPIISASTSSWTRMRGRATFARRWRRPTVCTSSLSCGMCIPYTATWGTHGARSR